jgi:hypothetical protein
MLFLVLSTRTPEDPVNKGGSLDRVFEKLDIPGIDLGVSKLMSAQHRKAFYSICKVS